MIFTMLATVSAAFCTQQPTLRKDNSNQKVIRDPAEYNAYMAALRIQDPTQRGAAMEAFARNYPDSIVYLDALEQAMAAHQQAGNQAKVLEVGRHILETHPHNLRAQAIIVAIDRGTAANGGPAAQAAMKEACPYAQRGLEELPRWQRPENMSEADFESLHRQMMDIFAGASGLCALQNKDYANARTYFERALQIDSNNLQNVYQLGVADLEMNPVDLNGFWYCAKAISLAERQSNTQQPVNRIADYCKSKYTSYHGNEEGWDGIVARAATERVPPPKDAWNINKAPTPAELAVQAVRDNDPANLSFSDWEFILSKRDASTANKNAADKVWQTIQAKEKNGQAKLKLAIKVISATKDTIHAAVTDENQKANREDIEVFMEKPISHLPAAGSIIDIMGVIQSYTPNPFKFTMNQGALFQTTPAVHTQLSEPDIEKLLHGGVTPKRAAELVKQKGVDFTLDDATEGRLREAGATDELLLAITKAKK
ncbi:MAG TPA: hypothetical protein VKY85_03460 [Candidatus Angelobacter sp.]|nr:hypothetical protein [Candidatus Angelobacter sp.]